MKPPIEKGAPLINERRTKIPDRPTLKDVLQEVLRLHDCVHDVAAQVRVLDQKVDNTREDLAHMKGVQETITQRMGVPNAPPQQIEQEGGKPIKKALILGSMSPFQAVMAVLGSLTGIAVFYQIMAAVVPALHRALMAVQ